MNDAEVCLNALVQRTRRLLWRRRLGRGLRSSLLYSAIALAVLAVIHLAFAPVPLWVWLPLGLLPQVIAAVRVLLWQRPSPAYAVSQLDRASHCDELLVSAWDVMTAPGMRRTAGADMVLERAVALCRASAEIPSGIGVTPTVTHQALPAFAVLMTALFLLQLPAGDTADVHRREPVDQADRPPDPLPGTAPVAASAAVRAVPLQQAGAASPGGDPAAGGTPEERSSRAAEPADERTPVTSDIESGQRLQRAPGRSATASEPGDAGMSDPAAEAPDRSGPDGTNVVHVEEIRRHPGSGGNLGAGKAAALSAAPSGTGAQTGPGSGADTVTIGRPAVTHDNRFSLTQRAVIDAYFKLLGETP